MPASCRPLATGFMDAGTDESPSTMPWSVTAPVWPRTVKPSTCNVDAIVSLPVVSIVALAAERSRPSTVRPTCRERCHVLLPTACTDGDLWHDRGLVFSSSVRTPLDADNVRRAFKKITTMYHYRIKISYTNGAMPTYTVDLPVSHTVSGVRRTWGSIKAMFRY